MIKLTCKIDLGPLSHVSLVHVVVGCLTKYGCKKVTNILRFSK